MNDDTKEALAKHGVYRARVTKDKLTQWRRQGRPSFCWQFMDEPSTSIRNLDILANHSPSSSFHGNGASCKDLAGLLPPLLDQMRDHVHCQVVLELPRHRSIAPEEVECLELLRIFKNVTIEVSGPLVRSSARSSLTEGCHSYATQLKRLGGFSPLTLPRTRCIGSMRIRRLQMSSTTVPRLRRGNRK